MSWNSDNQTTEQKSYVNCNGSKYDVTGLSGLGLVNKLKEIAREHQFSKFDIYDSTNRSLSPTEIESGNYQGDLNLVRFNAAA